MMPMSNFKKVLSILFLTLILSLVFLSASSIKIMAEENYGLALQLDETSGDTGDTATISFDDYNVELNDFFRRTGTIIDETIIKRMTEVKYFESTRFAESPFVATIRATSPRTIIPSPI